MGTMGGKPAVYAEDWSAEYNANTAFDLSANYWNGEKPVEGVAYATSGSNPAIKLDSYYTTISEGTGELGDLKTHYAARIGDQEYATLAEAVNDANAAADAVTIELLENIELSAGLKINNTSQAAITINGKGHVISPADGATFTGLIVEVRTDVAIHDVVFENFTTSSDIIAAYNGADLTLNGCTFQNNTCRTVITCTSGYENAFAAVDCTFSNNTDTRGVIYNGSSGATATFSVADSTFTGNTTGGAGIVNVGGVAIITGNAFSNNMVDTTNNVAGVLYPWNIDVTVTNNSFSGNTVQVTHTEGKPIIAASAIVVKSGDTTNDLSGNTITADNTVQTRISADADWTIGDTAVYVRDTGEGVVSITSGTINGSITSTDAGISITGGTFSVDPSEYVASGYVVNTVSGKYVVSEQPPTSGGGSTPPTVTVPVSSDSGSANVSASISGTAVTVSITDQDLSQVIASAGNTGNVVIDVSGLNNVTSAVIPSKVITAVNGAEDATGLTVALPGGSVGLDSDALAAVAAAAGGADVTMSVETVDTSKLSESQQAVLGNQISNAIVVDVSIMAQGTAISSFDGGTVTISVPYEPEEGTDTSKLVVWYLADDGTISPVEGAYDPATKSFVFKTSHLSTYALVSFPFEDVTAGSWYYGNVAYVFNNNLFNGTSSSTFSPDDTMTRAMLMTVLARMAGQDTAVEDGVWYEKGMNWAVENGISDGTNPEGSITREQLVTMLYRYAGSPEASGDLSAFSDADKVDGYATLAMQWAVGKGLINGMGDGTLAPRDTATRAQVAAILMRFCENIIA